MIHKEKIGNELYVYMNGDLLYKRWLNQNHGIILQGGSWGNFRASDVWQHVTDETIKKN
ncbi:MAG: hypothetical protein ABIP51_14995 [Bacteroidia bacterium]